MGGFESFRRTFFVTDLPDSLPEYRHYQRAEIHLRFSGTHHLRAPPERDAAAKTQTDLPDDQLSTAFRFLGNPGRNLRRLGQAHHGLFVDIDCHAKSLRFEGERLWHVIATFHIG